MNGNEIDWSDLLVGRRVVSSDMNYDNLGAPVLVLDDGTRIEIEPGDSDCCSWVSLDSLATTDHVITAAEYISGEAIKTDDGEEIGDYSFRIHVLTEGGEADIINGTGDTTSGYYLSGFDLDVNVIRRS